MDRELKFRVWDKTQKAMIHADDFIHAASENKLCKKVCPAIVLDCDEWYPVCWHKLTYLMYLYSKKDDYIIMQYSGLKDMNEVDIYEGDIVFYHFPASLEEIYKHYKFDNYIFSGYMVVEYSKNHAAFIAKTKDGFWKPLAHNHQFMEVVGNIFENPDLYEEVM